jgi:hypothetical protein
MILSKKPHDIILKLTERESYVEMAYVAEIRFGDYGFIGAIDCCIGFCVCPGGATRLNPDEAHKGTG